MPSPSDKFHTSSSHNSLHSSSSSVLLALSTTSLSGLRIGGPSTSTSRSTDRATMTNTTAGASQNLKFKEVLEYDNHERLIIVPDDDSSLLHMSADIWL
ncbi:hypothetical protein P3S68_011366 [Capsicum galapagoense]